MHVFDDATVGDMMVLRRSAGVSANEAIAMIALSGECLAMQDLATRIIGSRAGITTLVDRLEHRGYVTRQPLPGDRRVNIVSLTDQGMQALAAVGL